MLKKVLRSVLNKGVGALGRRQAEAYAYVRVSLIAISKLLGVGYSALRRARPHKGEHIAWEACA